MFIIITRCVFSFDLQCAVFITHLTTMIDTINVYCVFISN